MSVSEVAAVVVSNAEAVVSSGGQEEIHQEEESAPETAHYPSRLPHNLHLPKEFPHDAYPHSTTLLRLIAEERWDEIMARLESGPHYVRPSRKGLPEIAEVGFVDEPLFPASPPLHKALWAPECPNGVILCLINETSKHAPYVFQHQEGAYGFLPLHMACQRDRESGSDALIGVVLDRFPAAVWQQSVERETYPVHLLLEHQPTLALVERFCNVPPPDAGRRDLVALQDGQEQYPLMVAIDYHAPDQVIEYLIHRSRDSHLTERFNGFIPLQCAALHGCTMRILHRLLEEPGCIATTHGSDETTPLHYLFFSELDSPSHERWPYHVGDQWNNTYDSERVPAPDMARIMIRKYSLHAEQLMDPEPKRKKARNGDHHHKKEAWLVRAQQLVNETNLDGTRTVLQAAKDLLEYIAHLTNNKDEHGQCDSLLRLIRDMEKIKDGTFERKYFDDMERRWPQAWAPFAAYK